VTPKGDKGVAVSMVWLPGVVRQLALSERENHLSSSPRPP